jgi:hypothetical protein
MIDLIGTLRRLAVAVGLIATDTTDILAEVAGLDGDAMRGTDNALLAADYTAERGTDNAALAVNWTAGRAVYVDELAPANIPADVDNLLIDAGIIHHYDCSATRVYPQVPSSVIQLTTAAAADTWGSWTQVIPINTIDFTDGYNIFGVMVEQSGAAATYIIQFGYSTTDGDDPTTEQIMGEQRFKVIGTPLKTYHGDLVILSREAPQNAKLWARLMSETVNADTCDISVVVLRHIPTSNPTAHLTTWPWAS